MKDEFLQQVKSATGRSKTIKVWRMATENFWTKRATEELFLILKLQVVELWTASKVQVEQKWGKPTLKCDWCKLLVLC